MIYGFLIHYVWFGIVLFFVTFFVSYGIYPLVLRMARVWKIYDKPDERKLQRKPVPVLGGLAIFCSILISSTMLATISLSPKLLWMMGVMALLLIVGIYDDKRSLSVRIRFVIEISVIIAIVFLNHHSIDNFCGIFGIGALGPMTTVLLSVVAGVGIINAMNLIDGIDGYSSAYAMMVCVCVSSIFYLSNIQFMAILSLICAGAMLPFFLHNVFGKTTKMYIGDGGTLMIGMMIVVFCFSILKESSLCNRVLLKEYNVGLIPMMLAILSIAVFDTLRVMTARICRGNSPFHPDKTHLHHLFIDMGYSHLGTTLVILLLNTIVIIGWGLSWLFEASVTIQFYVVVGLSLLNTAGIYALLRYQERHGGMLFNVFCEIGKHTHWENSSWWKWLQKVVDDELFEEGSNEKFKEIH